jgi:hypothetical protein
VVGKGIASVTITGAGSAAYQSSIDGTSVYDRSFPGVITQSASPVYVGTSLDLLSVWDLKFDGGATMMGTSDLRASDAAVPEPMTLLLFGPGLAGLAALRGRRRSKAL